MMCRIQSAFGVAMCEAGTSRFREPKMLEQEEEEVILVHKAVPLSTKYKNKWATSIFYEWQTGQRTVHIPVLDSGGLLFNEFRYCR